MVTIAVADAASEVEDLAEAEDLAEGAGVNIPPLVVISKTDVVHEAKIADSPID